MVTKLLKQQCIDLILDSCRRITEADPKEDEAALDDLYKAGEILFGMGYEDYMREVCLETATIAQQRGLHQLCITSLCNSTWHGIGNWER